MAVKTLDLTTGQTRNFLKDLSFIWVISYFVVHLLSCVWLFVTPWAAARQASIIFTTLKTKIHFSIKFLIKIPISLEKNINLARKTVKQILKKEEPKTCMLLLLLSHISCIRLGATPETAAHQAPPSLGFSRQEHWSGLPFLSPMHESEKWKWSRSVVSDS